jgi:hypothetical protein
MAGLDPATQCKAHSQAAATLGGRVKPGHDANVLLSAL